jgi:hypothetical protein
MNGISISLTQLVMKGLPEGLLMTLAFHLFTNTKIDKKKFFTLAFTNILITYLIRFLPITMGVNTILSLLALIVLFQITYRSQLDVVVRSIVTAVVVMTMIIIAETLNYLILFAWFGSERAEEILYNSSEFIKNAAAVPSTLMLIVMIFSAYWLMKKIENRKSPHGTTQQKNSR